MRDGAERSPFRRRGGSARAEFYEQRGIMPSRSEYGRRRSCGRRDREMGLDRYAAKEFAPPRGINEGDRSTTRTTQSEDGLRGRDKRIPGGHRQGFPAYLDEKIADVESLKKSAEEIKAPMAVKNDYNGARRSTRTRWTIKRRKNTRRRSTCSTAKRTRNPKSVYDVALAKKYRSEKTSNKANKKINELRQPPNKSRSSEHLNPL